MGGVFEHVTVKHQAWTGTGVDHQRQIPRLQRIEGQVRGLQKMIQEGRYCIDVAYQIDAAIGGLRRVQSDLVRDHLEALAQMIPASNLTEAERRACVDEIASLMIRLV